MIIDLHNHTTISSPCSLLSPKELIETAMEKGLDGLCVTEHMVIEGATICQDLGKKMGFPVFRGIEARTDLGDMLVYGYYKDIPEYIPLVKLCSLVHKKGGVIFAAHPFRDRVGGNLRFRLWDKGIDLHTMWDQVPELRGLDGIEICNGQDPDEDNRYARTLQQHLGIKGIGGSDAHIKHMVACAATRFPGPITCDEELVHALKLGHYRALRLR
jgi:predicted metal-dependent phosphoesterase TrpH